MLKWLILLGLLQEKKSTDPDADAVGCALILGIILWIMGYFWLVIQHPDQMVILTLAYCLVTALILYRLGL